MDQLHRRILVTTAEREDAVASADDAPAGRENALLRFQQRQEREYGPRFNTQDWFGSVSQAERRRILRAIAKLEHAGLVEGTGGYSGGRLVHLRLTAAGRKALRGR